jgi:predicted nucleotidyltransferase
MPFRGTGCSRPAGNFLRAGRTPQTHLHDNPNPPACFKSTSATPSEHNSQIQAPRITWYSRLPRAPSTGQYYKEPSVDPDSLRNTLEAHREANRSSLIVKIAGKGSVRQHIDIPPRVNRKEQPARGEGATETRTWHLKKALRRGNRRRRQFARPKPPVRESFLAQWAPSSEVRYCEKYPWMKHMNPNVLPELEGRPAGIEELSREIDAFYLYSQPSTREKQAAELAVQEISTAIRKVDQNIKIDVVGSRATGLDLPMSDIDLNVSTSSTASSILAIQELLQKVASGLVADSRKKGLFRSVTTRFRPRVQLVTGRHASTHLEFQVQSTIDVFLSMQQTMSFINEFPTLPKLFALLKQMLTMRGLTSGTAGGITSYPLLVMIVIALKFSEGRVDRRDVGAHLLLFLDMYSDIDFTTTAISFSPLQYVIKRHPHSATLPHTQSAAPAPDNVAVSRNDREREPQDVDARRRFATVKPGAEFLMCLQDPADLHNDLGKAAFLIREIQTTFIRSREELKAALQAWDDGEGKNQQEPLLAPCIGGDYRIFENTRYELAASATYNMEDSSPTE